MNNSKLNPNALIFVPKVQESKLNPNAKPFVPKCPDPPANTPSYEYELVKPVVRDEIQQINMSEEEYNYYFFNQ